MKRKSYKGAGVMLFRYNTKYMRFEVLLGKRAVPKGYGQWAIIGGKMEYSDTAYSECALREFKEEAGVDLKTLQIQNLAVKNIDIPYFHWRTYLILTWGYFPEFKKNWENSELRWFPVSIVSKQNLWIKLDQELRAFSRLVKKHELIIAYHAGMPFEDANLLAAYRLLTQMKNRNPQSVKTYFLQHMDISEKEAGRLSRMLKRYYEESVSE